MLSSDNIYKFCLMFLSLFLLLMVFCLSVLYESIILAIISTLGFFIRAIISLLVNSLFNNTGVERKKLEKNIIIEYEIYEKYLKEDLFNNENIFPANYPIFSNLEIYMFFSSVIKNNKYDLKCNRQINRF